MNTDGEKGFESYLCSSVSICGKNFSLISVRDIGGVGRDDFVGRRVDLLRAGLPGQNRFHAVYDFLDHEGLAFDFVETLGVDEELCADEGAELAEVHLGDQHVLESLED